MDWLLDPLRDCFTLDVARRVADLQADLEIQQRVDELAVKANDGELTDEESNEHRALVDATDLFDIVQAKARAAMVKSQRSI